MFEQLSTSTEESLLEWVHYQLVSCHVTRALPIDALRV